MMATGSGDILPIPSSEDSLTVAGTAVRGTTTPASIFLFFEEVVSCWPSCWLMSLFN
jgi:hypothetical protein